jgi:hypothetical protein
MVNAFTLAVRGFNPENIAIDLAAGNIAVMTLAASGNFSGFKVP